MSQPLAKVLPAPPLVGLLPSSSDDEYLVFVSFSELLFLVRRELSGYLSSTQQAACAAYLAADYLKRGLWIPGVETEGHFVPWTGTPDELVAQLRQTLTDVREYDQRLGICVFRLTEAGYALWTGGRS